jgi:hypothetical protein
MCHTGKTEELDKSKRELQPAPHALHYRKQRSATSRRFQGTASLPRHWIKNVQRRLDLIYPGEHELDIEHDTNQFRATLRLNSVRKMLLNAWRCNDSNL